MWTSEYFSELLIKYYSSIFTFYTYLSNETFYIDLINAETWIHDPHMYDKYVKS